MKTIFSVLILLSGLNAFCQSTYYVDNLAGSDRNNGVSCESALKSIEKVNELELKPGDSVLFRRGGSWTGNLVPHGSGTEGKRIVIGAYGNGPAPFLDAKGRIAGGEEFSSTIRLFNQEFIEIRDLKIQNFTPFEKPRVIESRGNMSYVNTLKNGIYIEGKDCGTLHDIHLVNLEICNVNGDMSSKNNGGVFIEINWDEEESRRVKSNFNGLYTEGCHIHHVDRTGWSNRSAWEKRTLDSDWGDLLPDGIPHNWYPSEKIVIRNSKFEWAGANALIVRVAKAPLVEHCFFGHNGWKGSGNASFPFNCDDALFQYNEACFTVYNSEADSWNNRKDADAGGFDSDYRCKNTVIQYNYSHDNGYGGILICCNGSSETAFNDGTIVRYNIFENNGHHIIRTSGPATGTMIYNNVIFSGSEIDSVMLLYHKSWGGYSDSTVYNNNIFYSKGKGNYVDLGKSTRNSFVANTFYGNIIGEPDDPMKQKTDPGFNIPEPSESGWKSILRFLLQNGSPDIDKGVRVKGHAAHDIIGTPIGELPDRGAFENH